MLMDGIEFQKWNWPKRIKLTNLDDIHDTNEMYHMEMEGLRSKIYHMDEITHLKMNFVNEIENINGIDNMDDENYWMMKTHNIHEIIVIYEKWPSSIWLNMDGRWHYEVDFINEPTFIDVIKVSSMWLTRYAFSIPNMWYDPLMSSTLLICYYIWSTFSYCQNIFHIAKFHP